MYGEQGKKEKVKKEKSVPISVTSAKLMSKINKDYKLTGEGVPMTVDEFRSKYGGEENKSMKGKK